MCYTLYLVCVGSLQKHDHSPLVSSDAANLQSSTQDLSLREPSDDLLKAHGRQTATPETFSQTE